MTIPKEKLLKVIYKDVDDTERERIRKEEEEKLALLERKKEEERQRKRLQWDEEQKKKEERRLAEIRKFEESIAQKKENISKDNSSSQGLDKYFTSYNLATSIIESNLRIAPANSSCKPYAESSDWYWMFGTFPITKPDMKKILPKGESSIRIKAKNSWTDFGVSVLMGILGTVTRRTIVVETCGSSTSGRLYSEEELQLELQKQKLLLESKFGKEKE